MTAALPDNTPILVGIGEAVHRSKEPPGLEPLALMEQSLRAAEQDAGAPLLAGLDALDVVCEYSWPYSDAPGLLAARLGCRPAHSVYGETGGESPVRFIHEAALRIARGESQVAAIVGAEARYTVDAAAKAGVIGFTKSLALEVAKDNVLVNAIAPGPIETPLVSGISSAWKTAKAAELPLGRFGLADEVAPTAVLLASEPGGNLFVGQTLGPNSGDVMP